MKTSIWLGLLLATPLFACSADAPADDEGEASEALSSTSCTGGACRKLAQPEALTRGKLASVGNRLYWIGVGAQTDGNGRRFDELRHCTLPACSSVQSLTLKLANGEALRASQLHAANGQVFFVGDIPGVVGHSFFLSDGQTFSEIYKGYDAEHDLYAVDERGIAIYKDDRRTDGWARSTVRYCELAPGARELPRRCATSDDRALNSSLTLTLAGDDVVVGGSATILHIARSDGALVKRSVWTPLGGTRLFGVDGELVTATTVVSTENGHAVHDTGFAGIGSTIGGDVRGVLTALTTNGGNVYAVTRGEGDVWGIPKAGVVARLGANGTVTVLAEKQEPMGVTVSGSRVYWLDRTSPDSDEDQVGVVRYHAK